MNDEQRKENMIAVKLDAERRREIDEVRKNFEEHWRDQVQFQADMKNRMDIVANKQDHLKERFESGTAATLRELKTDFQRFLMEWGKKQEQDKLRDERIETVGDEVREVRGNHNWLVRSLVISVCSGVLLAFVLWAFQSFKG